MSKSNEMNNFKELYSKKTEFNTLISTANYGNLKKIDKKINKKITQNKYSFKNTNVTPKSFNGSLTTNGITDDDYYKLKQKIEDIENYKTKYDTTLRQHFKSAIYEFDPKNITQASNNVLKSCVIKKNNKGNNHRNINHYRDLYRYNKMNGRNNSVQNNIYISNYSIISNNNTNNIIVNKKNLEKNDKENKENIYSRKKIIDKSNKLNKENIAKNNKNKKNTNEKVIDDETKKEKYPLKNFKEKKNNTTINNENNDFEKYKNYINQDILDDYLNCVHDIENSYKKVDQMNEHKEFRLQNNQDQIIINEISENNKNKIINEKIAETIEKKNDISPSKFTKKLTKSKLIQAKKSKTPKNDYIHKFNYNQRNDKNLTKFKDTYNEILNEKNQKKEKDLEKEKKNEKNITFNNSDKNIDQSENLRTISSYTQQEFYSFFPNETFKKFIKNKLKYYIKDEEIQDKILSNYATYQDEFNESNDNELLRSLPIYSINNIKKTIQGNITSYDPEYEMMDQFYDIPGNNNNNNNKTLKKKKIKFKTQNNLSKVNKTIEPELYESKKKNLIKENNQLHSKLDKIEDIINDTRNEITKKNEKIKSFISEYDSINKENESNKKKIDNLKLEIKMKNKMVSNKKNLLNHLKDVNIDLESEFSQIREKYDNKVSSIKDEKINLHILENEYENIKNKYNNLAKKYETITKENFLLQKNQENYEEEIKSKDILINNLINENNLSYEKPNEKLSYEHKNILEKKNQNILKDNKLINNGKNLYITSKRNKSKYLHYQNIDLNNI